MNDSDIQELKNILKESLRLDNWVMVEDAVDYLSDFIYEEDEEIE